jgi:hypothetical protein
MWHISGLSNRQHSYASPNAIVIIIHRVEILMKLVNVNKNAPGVDEIFLKCFTNFDIGWQLTVQMRQKVI